MITLIIVCSIVTVVWAYLLICWVSWIRFMRMLRECSERILEDALESRRAWEDRPDYAVSTHEDATDRQVDE